MNKKLIEFNEMLKKDAKAQKQLQAAKNEEDFVKLYCQIAKQKGTDISPADVREFLKAAKKKLHITHTMNEEDLKKVAGGAFGINSFLCNPF